jgi:2-desacetyl-2-hydroxyethyl bacteriochlorophyllide A dehydrogenase
MAGQKRKIKAIVFNTPGRASIETFELPACEPNQVIAETIYTFVSPGTELRVFAGGDDAEGRLPVIPGYSWVGRIIEVGSEVKGRQEGELVTGRNPLPIPGIYSVWGGQASHHRCEVTGYDAVLKLPPGADPWDYITVEVAAVSWRGVSAAYPARGETAVVIGQGLIGAFAAKWLLYHGARVIVTDLEDSRLKRAREWGVTAAVNGGSKDAREEILSYCPDGADIVIEASSSIAGVKFGASLLRKPAPRIMNKGYQVSVLHSNAHMWPRFVFQAGYTDTIEMGPMGLVRSEGVVVLQPGDRTVDDRLAVIERIHRGDLPVADIISKPVPVENAPEAYVNLRDNPGEYSALAFAWQC